MTSRRVVVHGLVQGVGFRYSARAEAERLGISGWVRNRADGAVEAEIRGDADQLQLMLDWLARGPRGAAVASVEVSEPSELNESAEASGGSDARGGGQSDGFRIVA